MSKKEEILKKSSRSKADLFELLIANYLASHYRIKNNFDKLIYNLEKFIIDKFQDGDSRIKEQKIKAEKVSKELINFLKKEKIISIKDVEWVGRYHQKKETLSDVDLILKNNNKIGISLKSTRIGSGTQKNIGYAELKKYLLIDIDKELEKMWTNIRLELKRRGGRLELLSSAPKTVIKNKKRQHPFIEKIGKKYGYVVQLVSVKKSIENFNKLNKKKKSKFMKLLFGLEEKERRILDVIAQEKRISIYWNKIYDSIISGKNLQAKKMGNVSYGIYSRNKPIIRLQASFTNGIGISPYCQRGFLP